MYYNIPATQVIGQRPIATQKKIRYHYLSPTGLLLLGSHFAIGSLVGLCFWGGDMTRRKLTQEEFIERARHRHGNDRYDYSSVRYIKSTEKVEIICPFHGSFMQEANAHLRGHECKQCGRNRAAKSKKQTTDEFVIKLVQKRGTRYDYSLVEYKAYNVPVIIICSEHGPFEQYPYNHLFHGHGCPSCHKRDTEEFIALARTKHGDLYNYSQTNYVKGTKRITVICHLHGKFEVVAQHHIHSEQGCPECTQSKGEARINTFLKKFTFNFERQKTFEGCRLKSLLRYDFYLSIRNIRFLVEYDGPLHYWIPEQWGGQKLLELNQIRDKIKTDFALANGFILIRIHYKIKGIEQFLQAALEKHLNCSLDKFLLESLPPIERAKIIALNPHHWIQGTLGI